MDLQKPLGKARAKESSHHPSFRHLRKSQQSKVARLEAALGQEQSTAKAVDVGRTLIDATDSTLREAGRSVP